MAIQEAMKLGEDVGTVDAVMSISQGLMRCGLDRCTFDKDWKKVFHNHLGKLDEVTSLRNTDINMLTLYHCLLWKTGDGWTYVRSLKEMAVTHAYHPRILVALKDRMCSTTTIFAESLEELDLETLDEDCAALLGSAEHWSVVGVLQFFAQVDQQENRLEGPTSQDAKVVNVKDGNNWSWQPASERTDALNEPRWPGNLVRDDFTRSNTMNKLFEIRPPEFQPMCFAQFLCMYRHIRTSHPEYERMRRVIERYGDDVGPRCDQTLIAGTLELAPKFLMFENKEIVKLRSEKNVIVRLNTHNQALSDKTKVFLFGCWRRSEQALLDEEVASANIKECDNVRLHLYPASAHANE